MKTGSLLAIILFILVAVAHGFRLIFGTEILVEGARVPMWVSGVGVAVPLLIAFLLWRQR